MRKHSVRKFIHAILDCLPLMVIPIFAIYSQNHEINDNTLQVQENLKVDFNQKIAINTTSNVLSGITNDSLLNGSYYFDGTNTTNTTVYLRVFDIVAYPQHIYLFNGCGDGTTFRGYYVFFRENTSLYQNNALTQIRYQAPLTTDRFSFRILAYPNATIENGYATPLVYDLTQMFGAGNEPTIAEFNALFPNSYYEYTESQEMYIENAYTTTYDDTDIMSQFMYVTYNACDKYFNMNKVFNLGNIWNWVQNTLFNGSAPLSAFIVYNVIAYEFIMDIIFLIYMVFMFLMDFAESCIDNAFYKSKRGISR